MRCSTARGKTFGESVMAGILRSSEPVTRDRPEDLDARAHRARERAGDFRDAHAPAVGHWHLFDAQAQARRLHLHLARPAEVPVAHAEVLERVPAHRAEWTQVRAGHTVEAADEEGGERVAEASLRQESARLAPAEHPRAGDEVVAALDCVEQQPRLLRM